MRLTRRALRRLPPTFLGASLPLLALAACGSSSPSANAGDGGADGGDLPPEVTFPSGFMWGTATAAFQVEKGNGNTDWGHWAATPGKIKNGDSPDVGGPDALAHVDDDIAAMKSLGQNAYRFSIEWARIYPTRAAFDADTPNQAAIDAYAGILAKLKAAGIKPLVTLIHYSLPDYLSDITQANSPQGFERPELPGLVATYCQRMGKRFGDSVDMWATLNEPVLPALAGYIAGQFPPGLVLQVDRAFAYARGEARAHVQCVDALRAADTVDADGDGKPTFVTLVNQTRVAEPLDPTDPDDQAAAKHVDYINNLWFYNVAVRGDWDDDLDGSLDGPNDKKADPTLAGRLDFIGLNYYSAVGVSAHKGVVIPTINAAVYLSNVPSDASNARPHTDNGLDIYPAGMGIAIDQVKSYGLPVVITENGIADASDKNRGRFIAEHLYEVGRAIARGVDVRGYFHWSLVDNFEWNSGYCPRFGLFSVDKTTAARAARPSSAVYSSVVKSAHVVRADIAAMASYASPTPCQ